MPRNTAHAYRGGPNGRMQRSLAKARRGLAPTERLTLPRLLELLDPQPKTRKEPPMPMAPDIAAHIATLEAKITRLEQTLRRRREQNTKLRRQLGMHPHPPQSADDDDDDDAPRRDGRY
jgi:hypothetical protein